MHRIFMCWRELCRGIFFRCQLRQPLLLWLLLLLRQPLLQLSLLLSLLLIPMALSASIRSETAPPERLEEIVGNILSAIEESRALGERAVGALTEDEMGEIEALYRNLARHPLNINTASRAQLEGLGILSDFQVESILAYRRNHGPLLGPSELALLHGFDFATADLLKGFITFAETYSRDQGVKRVSSNFYTRSKIPLEGADTALLGPGWSLLLKERLVYMNGRGVKFSTGFVAEKDAGEIMSAKRPFDNLSGYLSVENLSIGKGSEINFIAGDYKIRLGQGLTIWKGFSAAIAESPLAYYKRGREVMPNNSADEENYLRGGAVWGRCGSFGYTAFLSAGEVDAKINEKGQYTSLQEGGLHNTPATLAKRRSMGEVVAGGSIKYSGAAFVAALNLVARRYGYDCGVKRREDNRLLLYNGWNSALSLSFAAAPKGVMLYGEVAMSHNGAMAALVGTSFRPWRGAEAGVLARGYSIAYIAPHSGAFSTLSAGPHNQYGVEANIQQRFRDGWVAKIGTSFTWYPWARYNIAPGSVRAGGFAAVEGVIGNITLSARLSELYNAGEQSLRFKSYGRYDAAAGASLRIMGSTVLSGGNAGWFLSAKASCGRRILRMAISALYFQASDWRCRLYDYETDLPQSYASQMLYGKGYKFYLYLKWRPCRCMALYLKSETLRYTELRGSKRISPKSNIKLGLQLDL